MNSQETVQQCQQALQNVGETISILDQLSQQADPHYVRARQKLDKAVFQLNKAANLMQKYQVIVTEREAPIPNESSLSKPQENGSKKQRRTSQSYNRWQQEATMS